MSDTREVLREWTEKVTIGSATIREDHLRLIVKPRPQWLPEKAWRWLLRRLLYLEERSDA